MKKFKLGVFGFGTVGQGFYEILNRSKNPNLEIKKIVVKNSSKKRAVDPPILSTTSTDIFNDPEIDIIVELIDDAEAAFEILKTSLQKRKPVVTANKKMLAENLEEIYWLQKKYHTPVLYEGAVCGSIPIIRNLEDYYAQDSLESIEGIFNGSTNYILTKMINEKSSYEGALEKAQKLGFAETDPSLDVKGFDPKFKLAISIAHAYGVFVNPEEIINLGIDKLTPHDIRYAKENNYAIKLIARASRVGNKITGLVAPQFVPNENPLAHIKDEFNGVRLVGAFTGAQTLSGKGAGSLPTGLAVFADVINLAADHHYAYHKVQNKGSLEFSSPELVNVYVGFQDSALQLSDFEEFTGGYKGQERQFMTGWITPEKLRRWAQRPGLSVVLNSAQSMRSFSPKKEEKFSLA